MNKVKIGAVSYLNALPLLHGIKNDNQLNREIELEINYPAQLVEEFANGNYDIALMPVASLLLFPNSKIVSHYGIGAVGSVASVCIFSNQPIETCTNIILDYQSRTSILLAQILLKEYWQIDLKIERGDANYINNIQGNTAGVIIGDRAMQNLSNFKYVYDLAEYWQKLTNLPFIFAGWIAQKDFDDQFILNFDEAQELGLKAIPQIVNDLEIDYYDMQRYYEKDIVYQLSGEMIKGLDLFLQKVKEHKLLS